MGKDRGGETVFLAKGGFREIPAIFVIFVRFRCLRSKTPFFSLWVECNIVILARFRQNPPIFGKGQKHRFPKTPFSQA